ncbi:MAG: DUF5688 family protein [Lachnospiraceae bacterium]|nr:DUF5688 family protein [Lachnospiraceae bacterium]
MSNYNTNSFQAQQQEQMEAFVKMLTALLAAELHIAVEAIEYRKISKNNGTELDAITIRPEGGAPTLAPTIYLERCLKRYQDGIPAEQIAKDIAAEVSPKLGHQVNEVITPGAIPDNSFATVINAKANEELLRDVPHRLIADGELAVIPRAHVTLPGEDSSGSFIVRDGFLAMDGLEMTRDELLDRAIANTVSKGYTLRGMSEVLKESLGDAFTDTMMDEIFPDEERIYVLTNPDKMYGANALLCKEALQEVAERFGEVFILPSSIHEVLIVPKRDGMELSDLEDMVRSVNQTEVPPEEVLADKVFALKGTKLVLARETEQEAMVRTHAASRSL